MANVTVPDRFEVLAEISSTDAETMFRARDRLLQREVFLKCPGPTLSTAFKDRDLSRAVLQEARALARVHHAYVVGLLDVLETASGPILVIEPVTGENLADRLAREGQLEPQEVLTLGRNLAEALEAVHTAGVVHRGICASSIVLGTDGTPCLTGFHYSKGIGLGGTTCLTSIVYRNTETGTDGSASCSAPSRPAPEQILGQRADARSDLFSLAWVLFECLTGHPPFESSNPFAWKHPPDPSKLAPGAPRALTRAIVQCLATDPSKRLASATAFRRFLKGATAPGPPTLPPRSRAFRPMVLWLSIAAVALAGGLYFSFGPRLSLDRHDEIRSRGLQIEDPGPVPALTADYSSSHALLIGIGQAYEGSGFMPLINAEEDVKTIAAAIAEQGDSRWDVATILGEEATRERVIDVMAELASRTRDNDRVFIYYAGHGVPHERSKSSGWMIPADADRDHRSSWVRFDEFFRFFEESRAKHILIAMDCCYAGRLTAMRSVRAEEYQERFLTDKAHVVIASGRLDEQVSDGFPGEHSPFARAMLQSLEGSGPITSSMLFAGVQQAFLEWDVGHTPQLGYRGEAPGEFVFFRDD